MEFRRVLLRSVSDRERLQSPEERERFDDTTKCILCAACTTSCPVFFFFSSRRRHTRLTCDWSSDVCSSDLGLGETHALAVALGELADQAVLHVGDEAALHHVGHPAPSLRAPHALDLGHEVEVRDRKSVV